jgi:hypothetical protein
MRMKNKDVKDVMVDASTKNPLPLFPLGGGRKRRMVQQVYTGLQAMGRYEAWYFLVVCIFVLMLLTVLSVVFFGTTSFVEVQGQVVSVSPYGRSGKETVVTIKYAGRDGNVYTTQLLSTRIAQGGQMVESGDRIMFFVNPHTGKASPFQSSVLNSVGISIIVFALVLTMFLIYKFFIIMKYPGLAASYPVLKAFGG